MDYFLLEQSEPITFYEKEITDTAEATISRTEGITALNGIDFLQDKSLISDRLKQVFVLYLSEHIWKPYVFINREKEIQEVFWYWRLQEYIPKGAEYRSDGLVSELYFDEAEIPHLFQVLSPKGVISTVLHLSAAESILRRGILGLTVTPIGHQRIAEVLSMRSCSIIF